MHAATIDLLNVRQDADAAEVKTLSEGKPGECLRLHSINAGKRLHERLLSMGFPIGTSFSILHNAGGSVVIACHNNRLAIGRGMAAKLMVVCVP